MSAKTEAIGGLDASYGEIQEALRDVPDERMAAVWFGEWSAKDLLAHVASWDEFVAADLQRLGRGHVPCLAAFKEAEVNDWNAFHMRPRRLFPLAQVRFESQHSHRLLLDVLNDLPEALFAPDQMVARIISILNGHYRDHADNIRQWRQREGI